MNEPILLLKGNDPVLLADGAAQAIDEIVGDRVRTEVLDLFVGDDYELTDAVIAASAASMFGDRVIVIRNASRFNTEALTPLLNYVADPNPTSTVVVVWDKPATPSASGQPVNKKLVEAVKKSGGKVQDCDVAANARVRQGWLDERIGESALLLTPAARTVILQRLGDEQQRLLLGLAVDRHITPALQGCSRLVSPVGIDLDEDRRDGWGRYRWGPPARVDRQVLQPGLATAEIRAAQALDHPGALEDGRFGRLVEGDELVIGVAPPG